MPRTSRSLISATTAALRRLVAGLNADNGAPTTGDNQMAVLGNFDSIDIVASCTGAGGSYDLNVWLWYAAAELWVQDAVIGTVTVTTAGGPVAFPLLGAPRHQCADGFYVRVTNFGGGGVASVWAEGRTEGR